MSHATIVFSPAGTPWLDRTVGEIVAAKPSQSRVFQSFGIDFCCQGGRTLRDACARKEVSAEAVIEQLEAVERGPAGDGSNPAELPAAELAKYIVDTHHEYLRRELPRLHMCARCVSVDLARPSTS